MSASNILRLFRLANNVSREELAEYLGVDSCTVSQIEDGDRPLTRTLRDAIVSNFEWDTTMFKWAGGSIRTTAAGNASVRVFSPGDDGSSREVDVLREQLRMTKAALEEERARSERYLQMIERLTVLQNSRNGDMCHASVTSAENTERK